MTMAILLHVLSAVIWVGGMFFAYVCLRPVAAELFQPPQRLQLWRRVFNRFFLWVWIAVVALPLTGHAIIVLFGGMNSVGLHVHLMMGMGYVMIAIFLYVYFFPYARLKKAVSAEDWPTGGQQLNVIRRMVGVNVVLGILTVSVAAGGRYIF